MTDEQGNVNISEQVQPLAADIGPPVYQRPVVQPAPQPAPAFDGQSGLQSMLSVIIIALFVITFIVQAFVIPSESMEKTLLVGDYLLVNKVPFNARGPWSSIMPYRDIQRGDIIVFHYPVNPAEHFVKRVIGIPGDHVKLRDKKVYVNETLQHEPFAVHLPGNYEPYRDNFPSPRDYSSQVNSRWRADMMNHMEDGEIVVPKDQYFVMGDNRDVSVDSRYWGFVPRQNVVGRPLVIYLSVNGQESTSPDVGSLGRATQSARTLAHIWQLARWNRMFRLVP